MTSAPRGLPKLFITRIRGDRVDGWYVRVPGEPVRLFSCRGLGGEQAALEAAKAHRDDLVSRRPLADNLGYRPGRRNVSGVVGVRRETYAKPGKAPYHAWTADWMEDGLQRHKRFGVATHGEDGARDLALAWRRAHVRPVPPRKRRS